MAEEVKIVDVAGGPAAEATLQELLKVMKQMDSKRGKGTGTDGEAQKLYNESVNKGTSTKKSNTKAVKENTEGLGLLSGAVKTARESYSLFSNLLGRTAGVFINFASAIGSATSIGEVLEAVPIFGSVLSSATGYFEKSVDTFRQLSEVGAGFGNDMMAMRNAAAESGLSLDQFSQMVTNNSSMLNLLGGTTSEGAARLGRLTNRLRQADSGLMQLGFTQEQLNDGMAGYIELQARSGRLQGKTDTQLTKGAQGYLLELDKLSRVTGKSRKELQDEMNQRMQSANVNVMAAHLNEEGATKFLANLEHTSSLLGQGMADVMADLGDGVAQSDFARILSSTVPGIKDLAEANARGELSQEEYQNRMKQLAPQIAAFADNFREGGVQHLQGIAGFSEFMESVANARKYTQLLSDAEQATAEQQRKSKITEQFATFSQTIQNVRSAFENALIDSGILSTVGGLFGDLGTGLTAMAGSLTETLKSYLGSEEFKKDMATFQEYIGKMKTRFQEFLDQVKEDGLWEAVKSLFGDASSSAGSVIGDILSQALKAALPNIDTMIVGALGAIGGLIVSKLLPTILGVALGPIVAPFLAIGGALLAIFGWETVKGWVSDGWDAIKGTFSGITDWWDKVDFMSPITDVWNSFTGMFSGIKNWWNSVDFMTPLTNAWETIKGFFSFGDTSFSISQLGSDAWNTVTGWFGLDGLDFSISALGTVAWEAVKAWFSFGTDVAFSIAQLGADAWSTVVNWFGFGDISFSISGLMSDAWNTITGFFNLGNIELPSISSMFSGIIDRVKNFFSFDFELPNFRDYLPSWLGGGGKSLTELVGSSSSPGTQATSQLAASTATTEPVTLQMPDNAMTLGNLDFSGANEGALALQGTLANISSLQSFNSELDRMQIGLNADNVNQYNTAMENLVDTLEELNSVLAEDNKGMFGGGTGVSAANVISGAGTGGSDQQLAKLDQLNTTMMMVLNELQDNTEFNRRISRSVRGNNLQA